MEEEAGVSDGVHAADADSTAPVAGGEGGAGSAAEGENKKKTQEGETRTKRVMKSASQLEVLERTYQVEPYPSESVRAELSGQLGLSDRQLQMWFCHRRLKDRKAPTAKRSRKDLPAVAGGGEEMPMGVAGEVTGSGLGFSPFVGHVVDPRRMIGRTPGVAVPRISGDLMAMKRYYEPPQQSAAELRAIAFVQAQLGEPLREDGPILGMEFDPLPPGAFGAPIGTPLVGQQKQLRHSLEASIYEQPAVRTIKGSTRAIHEYQFLPQQPTVRADSQERLASSHQYSSPADGHNAKPPILSTSRPFLHANEEGSSGFGFPSHVPGLSLMSQEGRQGNHLSSSAGEYEAGPRKNFLTTIGMDAQFGGHPITALSNPFVSSDPVVAHNEDILHMDRKRKSEEARIAREVEAHEKRIRKELEKHDILRRKREEQIRKEMERQDRERRKEEERLLREKQREEERYQREQRRELERREKYLQKESIRAEKMRQKEELRREKEAARQKAATEKAIARRAAKESMELVEDERLELMELACSSKGLPSILSLDYEALQDLDLFRDKLSAFPPKSVALKRPFGIQPWNDSEENVGNLLMVWRFLITFADVLGIWPFTLDEFVQAFHDYDPRLFGEIHIALLRSIIKDIEDGARTPATGLGTNQNSAANSGAGHPQVVEGAYAWGFDVRSWQCHLNPLTWPEVLRQFALSAGFGPQLKSRNTEHAHLRDDNEGNDGEDVINNLRNGVAVENAVALMHERGLSNPRRSRHRLTPGTVKFAAFHVLSLEGSKGLSILEVAEKIQKFGLRDLSTSKTPEASIAAALSRDSKLFERTAPSTYCVRSAYRKDPADAEAILAAAREKIQTSKVGMLDGEEADDAERDEDSDSDVAEDPEVDDLGAELNAKKEGVNSPEVSGIDAKSPPGNQLSGNQMESNEVSKTPQVGIEKIGKGSSQLEPESAIEVKGVASVDESGDVARFSGNLEQEDACIDESNLGEPWVLGLIEGEYTDLSVEERLNALVALIGVAIEGNSIRVVLEERLEAASALKKQMWAEAQLDKRRPKEEYLMRIHYSSYTGNKTGPNPGIAAAEGMQSPLVTVDDKTNQITINDNIQQERLKNMQNDPNCLNHMPPEVNIQLQDFSAGPDNFLYQQSVYVAEKTRSQLKSVIGHKAEEMYVYRSLPLGQDRRRNRYWQFITSASSNDPGCGRIFVELRDGHWRLIDSEEDFDALMACLDVRGIRESHLHAMLQKVEKSFKETVKRNILHNGMGSQPIKREANEMNIGPKWSNGDSPSSSVCVPDSDVSETSTSFAVELGRNEIEKSNSLKRFHDFEKWMWRECFHSLKLCAMKYGKKRTIPVLEFCDHCHDIYSFKDNYCPTCQKTHVASGGNFKFSGQATHNEEKLKMDADPGSTLCRSSPLRIKLLKLLIALIEASVLAEAFQNFWTDNYRKSWGIKLQSSSSAEDLLQILAVLEGAIKRDHLSSNFETTGELLGSLNPAGCYANDYAGDKTIPVLPWLPKTTAAVALRVMVLDGSISYMLNQKVDSQKGRATGDFILPPKFSIVKNMQDDEIPENRHQAGLFGEGNWIGSRTGLVGGVRGRGSGSRTRGRTRGGRPQRSVVGSRSESVKRRMATGSERLAPEVTWKGRARARGARKRGRRSTRSRQKVIKKAVDVIPRRDVPKESIYEQSSRGFVIGGWNGDEARLQVDEAENGSTSSEYNEENGQATGDEYDDLVADDYGGGLNGKPDDLMEGSDYNIDDDIDEEEQDDLDIDEYINGDPDEDVGSISSDYSD